MTKEEKALMLERLADVCGGPEAVFLDRQDRTLLRECAALMRERGLLLTERDWKGMYEVQEREVAALRKRVGELEADLATAGSNVHTLRDELRDAQQQMAADAMLIGEAQRGAEIVADTERRLERRIAELQRYLEDVEAHLRDCRARGKK